MKKSAIIILIFTVFFLNPLFSQQKSFRLGLKVSPDFSWFSTDVEKYDSKGISMGFSWGFAGDFAIAENYFISSGFDVEYLNGTLEFPHEFTPSGALTSIEGTMNRDYHLRYLEIPVSIKMRSNKFGPFAFFGQVGLGTAFNLKAKADDEFSYFDEDTKYKIEEETDVKDDIRFVKESWIISAGSEYYIDKSTSLFASVTFNSSLTNVLKGNNTVYEDTKQNAHLHFIAINVGILF